MLYCSHGFREVLPYLMHLHKQADSIRFYPLFLLFHFFFKYIFALTLTFPKKRSMKRQYLKLISQQEITFRSRTYRLKKYVKKGFYHLPQNKK